MEGVLGEDEGLLLAQRQDRHFRLERRRGGRSERMAEGELAGGWAVLEGEEGGVGVALALHGRGISQSPGRGSRGN